MKRLTLLLVASLALSAASCSDSKAAKPYPVKAGQFCTDTTARAINPENPSSAEAMLTCSQGSDGRLRWQNP